jgi:hypothetical protein
LLYRPSNNQPLPPAGGADLRHLAVLPVLGRTMAMIERFPVKSDSRQRYHVCNECQSRFPDSPETAGGEGEHWFTGL